ncbi:MAG: acyltransferase [bacterium]|nr:acyltransferase [bacterium]
MVAGKPSTDLAEPLLADLADRGGRMVFVDALRVVVIGWVIAHHAAQPYGPTGGDWPIADPGNLEWLRPLYPLGAAFGLGLLFFLAGYFVPTAYERKGAARFLKERWVRIGLPLLVFVVVVHLPVVYLIDSPSATLGEFVRSLYDSGWLDAYIHLWFLGHLVLYSVGYVVWRSLIDRRSKRSPKTWPVPNYAAVVGFVVGLGLVTWIVRGWYPIDEWVPLLFVVAAEPAHLPQYISLFALGVIAYRGDWLRRWPTRFGAIWLSIGLLTSAIAYAAVMLAENPGSDLIEGGGFTWQALLWSMLEALICTGMVVGMTVVARAVFRRSSRMLEAMAAASYAAYILHVTIVIGLQAGLEGVDTSAGIKFGIVASLGIVLAFGAGHLSRHVPGLRAVLGTTPKIPRGSSPKKSRDV